MNTQKSKLMIIDGNALIHRSFHALPNTMRTKSGQVTNAVYGFILALFKAVKDLKPSHIILTMDEKGPTFRHEFYQEYKANRIKQPDELYTQMPLARQIAEALNIPIFSLSGFEADDLIGTIVKKIDGQIEKVILTGDMDSLQLINTHTSVYSLSRGISESVLYNEKKVLEKYNLHPDQIVDYKALRGDPSDNIPGVKGIGEKTASALLNDFKTLENLYKILKNDLKLAQSKIKPRVIELLNTHEDDAFISQKLARINQEVDIEINLEKARFGNFNEEKLIQILKELEFESLIPRIKELNKTDNLKEDKFERNQNLFNYKILKTEKEFQDFLTKIKKQKEFSFDIEGTSNHPIETEILGIGFSWRPKEAYYLPLKAPFKKEQQGNLFETVKDQEIKNINEKLTALKSIFEDKNILKNGHNFKYDLSVLENYNIHTSGLNFDTRLASYLLDPGMRNHNLETLSFAELGHEKINKTDLLGKGQKKQEYFEVEETRLGNYCCEDADCTNQLIKPLKTKLENYHLIKLFQELEIPLIPVLIKMERNGILIDKNYLIKMEKIALKKIDELTKEIYSISGEVFNINSTQQLQVILFQKLKLPTQNITKTKTGVSTASAELEKLRASHPIINLIEEHRETSKLLNTYIQALPNLINPRTQRLHTSFNQTSTATGRLSSQDPNLQNIPVKSEFGRLIRQAFIAQPGYKLVSLDYSQIELRLAAHLSDDETMLAIFKTKGDIHTATAAKINKIKLEEVSQELRSKAKAINFGVLYGQGPHGLAEVANISFEEAREFIQKYFEAFQGVKKYIENCITQARENGFVETILGRRRYLPEINSGMSQLQKAAERMAINTPIQGSAADLIKLAMLKTHKIIEEKFNLNNKEIVRLLLQVHDELIFEIREDKVAEIIPQLKEIMQTCYPNELKVPIVVDIEVGDNWNEMS